MQKRGAVEAQFGWLFAVVAGTVILLLFAKMALQQKSNSERMLASEIVTNLDSLLISVQTSLGISANITLPDYEVSVGCEGFGVQVGDQYVESGFAKRLPIFSPSSVKAKVIAQALGWDVPFRAENFLYLTDINTAYVFIGSETDSLYDMIPHIRKYLYDSPDEVVDMGKRRVKLIVWDTNAADSIPIPSSLSKARDISATVIVGSMEMGRVSFYKKEGNQLVKTDKDTFPYLYGSSLIAAVFSEDAERYQCGMEKALKRLSYVSLVYFDVVYDLNQKSEENNELYCQQSYDNAMTALTEIGTFDMDNMEQIDMYRKELEHYNNALKLLGCPLIY